MSESEITADGKAVADSDMDFGAIVEAYQHKLFNTALRMTGNREDALDIVQNVFMKAYRSMSGFKGHASIYTWLYRIVVNTSLSFRRSAAVKFSRGSVSLDESIGGDDSDTRREVADERYEASASLGDRETMEHVSAAISQLEPELRTVVVLRDLEDLSYEEIALILEVPRGTVKSRLHRGRLVLREKLKEFL